MADAGMAEAGRAGGAGETDAFDRLAADDVEARRAFLLGLDKDALTDLDNDWQMWAHKARRPDGDDWEVWLMMAGRGFGKTRTGAEWINGLAARHDDLRIAIVSASIADARGVMIEGASGILARQLPGEEPRWFPGRGQIEWRSGALATIYSGANPEKLRGPEHHVAWCDELAKWMYPEASWNNLMLGMRLGEGPKLLVTTTPRPMPLLGKIMAGRATVVTSGATTDNPHLPPAYVAAMIDAYGGTRIERQELNGELIADAEGALWSRAVIQACRVTEVPEMARPMARVVIGVDPPGGSGPGCDACGIVAAGLGADGLAYVLGDASVAGKRPEEWARTVATAYRRFGATCVIAEKNQGGEMVEAVLRAADAALPVTLVHASRSKAQRAEPVSALYESGKVFHAGVFAALEDEMAGLTTGGGYEGPGGSPDRADALVWALNELMLRQHGPEAAIRML